MFLSLKSPWPCLLALLLLTLLTWHASLDNTFHFDDRPNITGAQAIQIKALSLDNFARVIDEAYLPQRILPNLSLAIDWWRGGGQAAAFQQTNLLIHVLNSGLVFCLLFLVFRRSSATTEHALLGALLAAACWSVHPIQVQSVTYIVQRMNSMASLFMLVSVITYYHGRCTASNPRPWYIACVLALLAGAISKENAWITPLLLLLTEFAICRTGRLLQYRYDRLILSLPVLAGFYVMIDLLSGAGPFYQHLHEFYKIRDFSLAERLLTQPRVLVFHLSQILWPLPGRFSIEHDFPISTALLTPWTTLPALLLMITLLVTGLLCLLKASTRLAGFFILWFFITLAIESTVIPLEMVFEHRLYLPSFGLAGLLGLLLIKLGASGVRQAVISRSVVVIVIACLACSTGLRLPLWSTQLGVVEQALRHAPHSGRVWNNFGTLKAQSGDYSGAGEAFARAVSLDPKYAPAYLNRGLWYAEKAATSAQALSDYDRAIALDPRLAVAWLERGNLFSARKDYEKALSDYSEAIRIRPGASLALNNRGLVYLQLGDSKQALQDFDQALRLEADYQQAHANRATALLMLRDYPAARDSLQRALELDPRDVTAHYNLALVLRALGQSRQAQKHIEIACRQGLERACSDKRH